MISTPPYGIDYAFPNSIILTPDDQELIVSLLHTIIEEELENHRAIDVLDILRHAKPVME